ncbi:Protein SSU-2 c [Aphelenchoides avenae]|nr:Protein SSU-2 c [Aphelenchus avenae]
MSPSADDTYNVVPPPREPSDRNGHGHDSRARRAEHALEAAAAIDEEDIRKSVLVEAKRRKVWGSKAVAKMEFFDIEHSTCYRYTLESFTETRSTSESAEAVEDSGFSIENYIDITSAGTRVVETQNITFATPQNPWDYEVLPDEEFLEAVKVRDLPDSTRVTRCPSCNGTRLSHCFHCQGHGTDKCLYCRSTGMKAGVAHPAVYTHPMIGTFPNANNPIRGGGHMLPPGIVRPPNLDKPYAVGTPVHFMAKAGLPPPGIGQHDLCIHCKGHGIRECGHCKGVGKKACVTCGGNGNARVTTKLKVLL